MKLTEKELYSGVGYIPVIENFDEVLNFEPRKDWLREHPQVKGFMYLPIERVEFLLNRLFSHVQIEIREIISSESRAIVSVRVNYTNREDFIMYHDGIGAVNITKSQPAEMSFPMAKTLAIKDACDMFGKIFGKDLNRKEVSIVTQQKELTKEQFETINRITHKLTKCSSNEELQDLWNEEGVLIEKDIMKNVKALFTKRKVEING